MRVSREQEAKILALAGLAPDAPPDRAAPDLIAPHVEVRADGALVFVVPCVVPSLANERQWQQRNRVAQAHRRAVSRAFGPHLRELAPFAEHYHANRPLAVLLTRLGGHALDRTANLPAALKYIEDALALMLGADDGAAHWVCRCEQQPGGPTGARIELRRA